MKGKKSQRKNNYEEDYEEEATDDFDIEILYDDDAGYKLARRWQWTREEKEMPLPRGPL